MAFAKEIQQVFADYDRKKGLLRKLFGDAPAIKALPGTLIFL